MDKMWSELAEIELQEFDKKATEILAAIFEKFADGEGNLNSQYCVALLGAYGRVSLKAGVTLQDALNAAQAVISGYYTFRILGREDGTNRQA